MTQLPVNCHLALLSLLFFFFVLEEHKSWLLVVVVGLLAGETTELTCYDAEEE